MPKKGAWTKVEDLVLTNYVKRHGVGNWNMDERTTGMKRYGKSCRLRWFNHLRPKLKKGAFSSEEERIVVELHVKIGNRWAQIDTKLSERRDNDIKNFWNTRANRLKRAGLPLYSRRIVPRYNQKRATLPSSSNGSQFSSLSERRLPRLVPYTPIETRLQGFLQSNQIETRLPTPTSTFGLSSHLPVFPFSNPYPRNDNGGILNFGMPSSYEPLRFVANVSEGLDLSILVTGSNLTTMSRSYNLQSFLTPPHTDDSLLEDVIRIPETLIPAGTLSDKGASRSSSTITGKHIDGRSDQEMLPLDDMSALLESF